MGWLGQAVTQALLQLRAHRDRALLTLFGITWGTAAMVALVSWGGGMRTMVGTDMRKVGDNLMLVWPGAAKVNKTNAVETRPLEIELADVAALDRHVAAAAHVIPEFPRFDVPIRYHYRTVFRVVSGVTPDAERVRKWTVTDGRFINAADVRQRRRVCLLGGKLEADLFQGADPLGKRVIVRGVPLTVIGRLAVKNNIMVNFNGEDDYRVLVPATTLETYFPEAGEIAEQIVVQLATPMSGSSAEDAIRRYLADRFHFDPGDESAVRVFDMSRVTRLADFSTNAVRLFVGFVGAATLLVAGFGVMNIMLVSVRERTAEVGLRLAVGARPRDIFLQFLAESLVVTALGGLIGITFALVVCTGVAALDLPPMVPRPELSWGAVIAAALTMTLVGVGAGTWPAYQAARLDPVDALRFE